MRFIFKILLTICFLQFVPNAFFGQGKNGNVSSSSAFANTVNKREADSLISEFTSKLLPMPKRVSFHGSFFLFNEKWIVDYPNAALKDKNALQSLIDGVKKNLDATIKTRGKSSGMRQQRSIQLIIKSGSVKIGEHYDKDIISLEQQAYRLELGKDKINIVANSSQGLFYGVQTFLQLLNSNAKEALLPEGEIVDWPDFGLRMIFWDDSHHLERLKALKRAIDNAARFKINGFILKLEGHFQYKKASVIVEPYALSPSEHQALTDYAKARHIELIPYLDAPAHVSYILKHPEYASLRSFPNSNYQMSVTNPKSYELLLGMFDELMEANRGGKYIFLSTDEAYYVGKTESEKEKAKELGGNGRLLADFISKVSDYLHKKGRTVIFWGEAPLTPVDVKALPTHLINGINQNSEIFGSIFKDHGIRNLVFTSTQGVEPLFPEYHKLSGEIFSQNNKMITTDDELMQGDNSKGRVAEIVKLIRESIDAGRADIAGVLVCGWADTGLHPETFWLGYAAGTAAAWNIKTAKPTELTEHFYNAYYGSSISKMDKIYRLLSHQTQFWSQSWDWDTTLNLRTPIIGNSKGVFPNPQPVEDQTLPALPIPSKTDLSLSENWSEKNKHRLQLARKFLTENDELMRLLHHNLRNVEYNQYNLEVLVSIASLCRNNLDMLLGLERIDSLLKLSSKIAGVEPSVAIALIDQALEQAALIYKNRNEVFQFITTTWYEDWHPRTDSANGRKYLNKVDDVKDHLPVRTIDMSYLIYRDLHYPLGVWTENVRKNRNEFAKKHELPVSSFSLNWREYN